MIKLLHRLSRRKKHERQPLPRSLQAEEEEYEVANAQREAREERERFAENMMRKAAHSHFPFLDDPFD